MWWIKYYLSLFVLILLFFLLLTHLLWSSKWPKTLWKTHWKRLTTSNNRKYFFVSEKGIRIWDTFRFYYSDPTTARSSVTAISSHLRSLNRGSDNTTGGDKQEVFGGLIFSSCGRGFFREPNIDSSPFVVNFPGVTLGGTFCRRVIGSGVLTPYAKESQEQKAVQCCVQPRGAVYLIMSYQS